MEDLPCEHFKLKNPNLTITAKGCEECLKIGDTWVHLRACLICGKVGCCDSSKNKHATAHFKETGHQLIQSFQPDETWEWCYVDEVDTDPGTKEYKTA